MTLASKASTLSVFALALATQAQAVDFFFDDDVSIIGNICVGSGDCPSDVTLTEDIVIRSSQPAMRFEDTDSGANEWLFQVDDLNAGPTGSFAVENDSAGTRPFVIETTTPTSTLYLDNAGYVGMGTSLPETDLHIATAVNPAIRLHKTSGADYRWDIVANQTAWYIEDVNENTFPLVVESTAPSNSLRVTDQGNVGFGTEFPAAQLELSSDASFNFFRISATGAAVNDSVDITFTGGPLGTGQLRYNIVDGDNQEMSLDANGNMVLDGTLTTAGPTCAGGCDRVFDADYALPSITEHANQMFEAGYLPSIGATVPNAPVNLSERQGNIINSLEHAHIFIAQQQDMLMAQQATIEAMQAKINQIVQ